METVEYTPGRLVDLHRGTGTGHVVMWHGRGPEERGTLATLARLVSDRGPSVMVPDWSSEAGDGGRADLLRSLRFARELVDTEKDDPDSLVLVGWSLGGTAAAGLTIHARRLGVSLRHTVCLAGGFTAPDPISRAVLGAPLPGGESRSPFTLIHGVADDQAPVAASRSFAQILRQAQWPVDVVELPTDHVGIVGAAWADSDHESCAPAPDAPTRAVAAEVADRVAVVTSSQ